MIIEIFFIIACIFGFIFVLFCWDSWSTHKDQVDSFCKTWDYSNFKTFLIQFKKIKWEPQDRWRGSLFCRTSNSQIHAGIIQFNGVGMVLKPLDYFTFILWSRKVIRVKRRKQGLWDKPKLRSLNND